MIQARTTCLIPLLVALVGCDSSSTPAADGGLDLAQDVGRDLCDGRCDIWPDLFGGARDGQFDIDESRCSWPSRADAGVVQREPGLVVGRKPGWSYPIESAYPLVPPALLGDSIAVPTSAGLLIFDRGGKLLWTKPGRVTAVSAAKSGAELVYAVSSRLDIERTDDAVISVSDTGAERWSYDALPSDGFVGGVWTLVRSSDGGAAFISRQRLIVVDGAGKLRWQRDLPFFAERMLRGPDDWLFVFGEHVLAFDREGTLRWRIRPEHWVHRPAKAEAVAVDRDGRLLVAWKMFTYSSELRYLHWIDPRCGRVDHRAALPRAVAQIIVDDRNELLLLTRLSDGFAIERRDPRGELLRTFARRGTARSMLLGSDGVLTVQLGPSPGSELLRLDGSLTQGPELIWASPEPSGPMLLLDGGLLVFSGRVAKENEAAILALPTASPRLMPAGWPRVGGDNESSFSF